MSVSASYDVQKDLLSVRRTDVAEAVFKTPLSRGVFAGFSGGRACEVVIRRPARWEEKTVRMLCAEMLDVGEGELPLPPGIFSPRLRSYLRAPFGWLVRKVHVH